MKKALLLVFSFLCLNKSQGQPIRLGLGVGGSLNLVPTRAYDHGDYAGVNLAYVMSGHYMVSDRWQMGGSLAMSRWSTTSDVSLFSESGRSLGSQKTSFVLAQRAFSIGVEFNHVIPTAPMYADFIPGEIYFGVSAGALFTGGEPGADYASVNPRSPRSYTYRSELRYGGGDGFFFGGQAGYSYYFTNRFGIDVNVAARWAAVQTVDSRYGGRNERFDIFWFPSSVGIKLRLGAGRSFY